MKVLMLTPYLPYPLVSGGQVRTYNLLKHLSQEHQITLFSLIKDDKEKQYLSHLTPYCQRIQLFKRTLHPWALRNILLAGFTLYPFLVARNWPLHMRSAVKKELQRSAYDLIHAETFYMMPNIPPTSLPIILAEQTIEYLGYQHFARKAPLFLKPFLYLDIAKLVFWEKRFWQKADKLVTMSAEDKQFIQQATSATLDITVVANGVDVDFFSQVKKKLPSHPTVLFVGTFKWLPNIEAVDIIVNKIWPLVKSKLPQARLKIVGFSPTKKILSYAQDPTITVLGNVTDIRTVFASAHLLLAPIVSGKGTRFKILEALMTRTPVVATPLAVEGIKVKPGRDVLVANDPSQLAALTLQVLTQPRLHQQLARSGQEIIRRYYAWDIIASNLSKLYKEIGHHA